MLTAVDPSVKRLRPTAPQSLHHRGIEVCAANNCKARRPPWSGFWGLPRGYRSNHLWFCSLECLEVGLAHSLETMRAEDPGPLPATHRMPLGLTLLSRGVITEQELHRSVRLHRSSGERIGRCLIESTSLTEDDITTALASQWCCPVFPVRSIHESATELLPLEFVERLRMMAVHFVPRSRNLYVAFTDRVDRAALYAIEQMLDCHTEPCILSTETFNELVDRNRQRNGLQVVIETYCSSSEIARMVLNYAQQTRANETRQTCCGTSIWVRVLGSSAPVDLLFARYRQRESLPKATHVSCR
jgi:hypothetical protein